MGGQWEGADGAGLARTGRQQPSFPFPWVPHLGDWGSALGLGLIFAGHWVS